MRKTGMGKKKPEVFEVQLGGDVPAKWAYAREQPGREIACLGYSKTRKPGFSRP